jgi:hypothetical protein
MQSVANPSLHEFPLTGKSTGKMLDSDLALAGQWPPNISISGNLGQYRVRASAELNREFNMSIRDTYGS